MWTHGQAVIYDRVELQGEPLHGDSNGVLAS